MPYSCWITATSHSLNKSADAATDAAEPLTSSPTTRGSEDGSPSATRTTLTSAPFAANPLDSAALNVASPQTVDGNVLRTPKLEGAEFRCAPTGLIKVLPSDNAVKVIPTVRMSRRC